MMKNARKLYILAGTLFMISSVISVYANNMSMGIMWFALGALQFSLAYAQSKQDQKKAKEANNEKSSDDHILDKQLLQLIDGGQATTAVKVYREMKHCELAEANDYVEALKKSRTEG